jgi:hypothetical protein
MTLTQEDTNQFRLDIEEEWLTSKKSVYYLTINWVICTDRCDHWPAVSLGGLIPNAAKNRPHVRSIRSARLYIENWHFFPMTKCTYPMPITSLTAFPSPAAIEKSFCFKIYLSYYSYYLPSSRDKRLHRKMSR